MNIKYACQVNPHCLDSKEALRATLLDLYPSEQRDINLVVDAYCCGIHKKIEKLSNIDSVSLPTLIVPLIDMYGLRYEMAQRCIEIWASAYDVAITVANGTAPKAATHNQNRPSLEKAIRNALYAQKLIGCGYEGQIYGKLRDESLVLSQPSLLLPNKKPVVCATGTFKFEAVLFANGQVGVSSWNEEFSGNLDVAKWHSVSQIAVGENHIVGLKKDGTLVATGLNEEGQCNVSSWRDITMIAAAHSHTVGLKTDGTVVSTGSNKFGECNTHAWTDVVSISAGGSITFGLTRQGTVLYAGVNASKSNFSDWNEIVAITTAGQYLFGLQENGTVLMYDLYPDEHDTMVKSMIENESRRKKVIAIAGGADIQWNTIAMLNKDGSVTAFRFAYDKFEIVSGVSQWRLFGSPQ